MNISSVAITDRGRVREKNEDNFYLNGAYKRDTELHMFAHKSDESCRMHVYAIADGMGGESKGEIASLTAMEILGSHNPQKLYQTPNSYVQEANRQICIEIENNNGKRIGTTLSLLMIKDEEAVLCHIGDSRIYRLRDGALEQLSKDHTRAQQMIDAGIFNEEQAKKSKQKHVLTQHLGIFPQEFIIEPQIERHLAVKEKDIYLLCSDGLTDMLDDEEIKNVLIRHFEADVFDLANTLVQMACDKGGKDNVSVVLAKVI